MKVFPWKDSSREVNKSYERRSIGRKASDFSRVITYPIDDKEFMARVRNSFYQRKEQLRSNSLCDKENQSTVKSSIINPVGKMEGYKVGD